MNASASEPQAFQIAEVGKFICHATKLIFNVNSETEYWLDN
jgi:hypothetical protein